MALIHILGPVKNRDVGEACECRRREEGDRESGKQRFV